mmetsp:Transcript_10581/g.23335  ORF Transcript_10581/g.23335 Transcript_10581/m.23335 type:complete len:212 (+) Transcript_10581:46-681(+)
MIRAAERPAHTSCRGQDPLPTYWPSQSCSGHETQKKHREPLWLAAEKKKLLQRATQRVTGLGPNHTPVTGSSEVTTGPALAPPRQAAAGSLPLNSRNGSCTRGHARLRHGQTKGSPRDGAHQSPSSSSSSFSTGRFRRTGGGCIHLGSAATPWTRLGSGGNPADCCCEATSPGTLGHATAARNAAFSRATCAASASRGCACGNTRGGNFSG